MDFQEIAVGILVVLAVVYLIRFFVNMTKKHDCGDCSLMKMKNEGQLNKK